MHVLRYQMCCGVLVHATDLRLLWRASWLPTNICRQHQQCAFVAESSLTEIAIITQQLTLKDQALLSSRYTFPLFYSRLHIRHFEGLVDFDQDSSP